MNAEIAKLNSVWTESQQTAVQNTLLPEINFEDIISSVISTGPFYYYIIDFFDMSLSNVSPSIMDIHGFDPEEVTFYDILGTIHPNDIRFVFVSVHFVLWIFKSNKKERLFATGIFDFNYCCFRF